MGFSDNLQNRTHIDRVFSEQKEHQYKLANKKIRYRIGQLKKLKKAIEKTYRDEIRDAMHKDLAKHPAEVDLTEIYPVIGEIRHALGHIHQWTKSQRVGTPLALVGSSSRIKYEPKGVCLIISPWNFPFNLTFGPLVSAIAAGNTVIIKPSEHTPNSSALMKKIVDGIFEQNEVCLIEGAVETSTHLLSLPFNHIFFTGAPMIGKIVMEAAAKNLASVTLELGGKSPTIVDETAHIKSAVKRIVWGKFLNSGQVCIAPDFVYVHKKIKDRFTAEVKKALTHFFGKDASVSEAYPRIVNKSHSERVIHLLEDAKEKGAKIDCGGTYDEKSRYIAPTILSHVSMDSMIMQQEIFGPLLPILEYENIDTVIDELKAMEKPLALYVYSRSKSAIKKIMDNTRAGGTCINNNDLHFFNCNLPFGGANHSGIGKSHGFFGFQAFSNARAIYTQQLPSAVDLLTPPYSNFKQKMINFTIKYF